MKIRLFKDHVHKTLSTVHKNLYVIETFRNMLNPIEHIPVATVLTTDIIYRDSKRASNFNFT